VTSLQKNALIGALCVAIGFVGGREQMKSEIASTVIQATSQFAEGFHPSKHEALLRPVETKKNPSETLAKISVSNISFKRVSIVTEMHAHVKNSTANTIASFTLQYSLLSPGREVPWVKGDDVNFVVNGGLAPGEERDLIGIAMNPDLILLKSGIEQHPDAVLNIGVAEARLPNGAQME
jgi:hypothetical protein